MKNIEEVTIIRVNDNTFANENDPIISIDLEYEDGSEQGTAGYRGNAYTNFIKNIMTILEIEEKEQMIGKKLSACTDVSWLYALGNLEKKQWIDLKRVDKIITGDIIRYFEEKDLER